MSNSKYIQLYETVLLLPSFSFMFLPTIYIVVVVKNHVDQLNTIVLITTCQE